MAMVLTLCNRSPAAVEERSVVPACLQSRAPLGYEIRDEHDRRVPPTLAGYKLRCGKSYRLRVRTQERSGEHWQLRLPASRSLIEPPERDLPDGNARVINFDLRPPAAIEPWKWLSSKVTSLPVILDFADGRQSYTFAIPVIVKASPLRFVAYFLATAVLAYLSQAWFRESWVVPEAPQVLRTAAIGLGVLLLCVVWDQWKFYRQALKLWQQRKNPTGQLPATGPELPPVLSSED